jgi:hypothetical protein
VKDFPYIKNLICLYLENYTQQNPFAKFDASGSESAKCIECHSGSKEENNRLLSFDMTQTA